MGSFGDRDAKAGSGTYRRRDEAGARPPESISGGIAGVLANINRGLTVGDEMAGAIYALRDIASGRSKVNPVKAVEAALTAPTSPKRAWDALQGSGIPRALQGGMAQQRAVEDDFTADRPKAAALSRGVGNAATAFIPGGGATIQGSRMLNSARAAVAAATPAAAMAFADRGSLDERAQAANQAALIGGVLGAGVGAAAPAAPREKLPKLRKAQEVLQDAGVFLTPGQRLGSLAKSVEDLGQRAPILGPAIRSARGRGVASLNRAVANEALAPLGEFVPRNVPTGHASVAHVEKRLGQAYDEAADMVTAAAPDQQFIDGLNGVQRSVSELNPDVAQQFRSIFANRVDPLLAKAQMTGRDIRSVQKQIGKLAADKGSSSDEAQRALGGVLEDLSDELKGLMGRASPEAGELVAKANEGWKRFVRLRTAAAKANADGIFSAGQLSTAVRQADKSVGKGNVAAGRAVLQDISSAASQVMPDGFGNPGTADAVGLGALGMGLVTAPAQTAPVALGLTAAATPYMLMGRKIVDGLPASASQAELRAAQQELSRLAQKDPAVTKLLQKVAARAALAVQQNKP